MKECGEFVVAERGHVAFGAIQTGKNRRKRNIGVAVAAVYGDETHPRGCTSTRERARMARQNYFNTLTMAGKLEQLGKCRFMDRSEFASGVEKLRGKKVVIVGCGAQGLNQGLNMRDSGLDVSYALRQDAIDQKRVSYTNATSNGFKVGNYEQLIPTADLVCNLSPDKQHADVVQKVMPLMKKGACLAYSHG